MFLKIFHKLFGTPNERFINELRKTVDQINKFEPTISKLSDDNLKAKTIEFKERLKNNQTLDDILPEAFAVVREAAKRVLNQRHYDVQLIGGIVMHKGMISEMRTGEGKTLVATLPSYLNALTGEGVHVVTVNDYLVKRDSAWMGKIHEFLGLTVGCVVSGISDHERRAAYESDITYATNNELGFDYLRDNMKYDLSSIAQRKLAYAIVDEVDSILVDEARTPLIISGPTDDYSELYKKINHLIPFLVETHYEKDEKSKSIYLTDEGNTFVEDWLNNNNLMTGGLYDVANITFLHHVNQALRAHLMFSKDVDYIVKNNQVLIIDEFTGRIMDGRRYSEGLHQALEAKENVQIKSENQTLASITYQNYFRMYDKLAGMTGTAMTEANEFKEIYNLRVVEIPTNLSVKRIDEEDEIYRTEREKLDAILKLIKERHNAGQPILIGTTSIEKSEEIAKFLKKENIKHQVLNAKYHEQEAEIIAQAGRKKAVMIATNMAGRGTDIMLGGNPEMLIANAIKGETDKDQIKRITEQTIQDYQREKQEVLEAGGLLVIGTERHESRRIDNQLRGRSGRQGDPGKTKFFLSLEDDLMRVFGSEKLSGLMLKLGMEEGVAISHPWVSKALQKAQHRVEARNYDIRKSLLKYDDVMNEQRTVIYEQRKEILSAASVFDVIENMVEEVSEEIGSKYISENELIQDWDFTAISKELQEIFGTEFDFSEYIGQEGVNAEQTINYIIKSARNAYMSYENKYGSEVMRFAERRFLILTLDQLWKDHLLMLDHLRQGIGLRAYGQKDPLNEYKKEAFNLFKSMLEALKILVLQRICFMQVSVQAPEGDILNSLAPEIDVSPTVKPTINPKIGRNDLCPCGSGKKYKYCCGKIG